MLAIIEKKKKKNLGPRCKVFVAGSRVLPAMVREALNLDIGLKENYR